jgi:N4-gp56 family major capsid protein
MVFAEFCIPFGMISNTTRTQVPAEVDAYYDNLLLARALPNMPHIWFGQKRPIPPGAGSAVIRYRRYTTLAAATTPLSEGALPAGKQLAVSTATATALQYGDYVQITDVVSYTTADPLLQETNRLLAEQMANTNDVLAAASLAASGVVQFASKNLPGGRANRAALLATDVICTNDIDLILKTLSTNNARKITSFGMGSPNAGTVPVPPCFVGIMHPVVTLNARKLTEWTDVEKYAATTNIFPGEIGKIRNVRFIESSNAYNTTDHGLNVYITLVLGADAYGVVDIGNTQGGAQMIYKGLGSSGLSDPLNQMQTCGWKEWFVTAILNTLIFGRIENVDV